MNAVEGAIGKGLLIKFQYMYVIVHLTSFIDNR